MAGAEQPRGATVGSALCPVTPEALDVGFAWLIVELAPDGILVSDASGRILMVNHHIEEQFGYGRDALVGGWVESLLPARMRRVHETHRSGYAAAPALRPMGTGRELFGCRADGSEFPVEVSLSPVVTNHGIATVVVVRDLTRQRAREGAARATSTIDEDERIAADLHDAVIGRLFGCGLSLASVLGRNQLDDGITIQLHEIIDDIDRAIREIRNTVFARLGHTTRPDSP